MKPVSDPFALVANIAAMGVPAACGSSPGLSVGQGPGGVRSVHSRLELKS